MHLTQFHLIFLARTISKVLQQPCPKSITLYIDDCAGAISKSSNMEKKLGGKLLHKYMLWYSTHPYITTSNLIFLVITSALVFHKFFQNFIRLFLFCIFYSHKPVYSQYERQVISWQSHCLQDNSQCQHTSSRDPCSPHTWCCGCHPITEKEQYEIGNLLWLIVYSTQKQSD